MTAESAAAAPPSAAPEVDGDAAMSSPVSPPCQIRSARELHEALIAPDPATRLGALQAMRAQPQAALAFGLYCGRDAIDLLLAQVERTPGQSEWLTLMSTLSAFRDARVTAFFVKALASITEPSLVFAVAAYVATQLATAHQQELRPLLLDDDCPARARAVAPLLVSAPTLTARERLRLALLDHPMQPPPLDRDSAEDWLSQLRGPFRDEARVALETNGAMALTHLADLWDKLADDSRAWLLRWGVRAFPDRSNAIIQQALFSGGDNLVLIALEGLAQLRDYVSGDPAALQRFATHADPALRRAAIIAGCADLDWRCCLASDPDAAVRRACVSRLAQAEGLLSLPDLIALLNDTDWQMRAVATQTLIDLGAAVVDSVKPLVHGADQGVRIAAVQVLVALGHEAWLTSELATTP
jgi:HEAT repeat protein